MSEVNAPATLVTPNGTILFNQDLGDGSMYLHQKVSGLDGAPRRAPTEDRPVRDGYMWHDFYKKGRNPTFEGYIIVANDTAWNQVVQRNQMKQALEDALDSIAAEVEETGTYSWEEAGLPIKTLTVRNDIELNVTGGILKTYVFGLVAANPSPYGL